MYTRKTEAMEEFKNIMGSIAIAFLLLLAGIYDFFTFKKEEGTA